MANVFLSYAREDGAKAAPSHTPSLHKGGRSAGPTILRAERLTTSSKTRSTTPGALLSCGPRPRSLRIGCAEAAEGMRRGILVPVPRGCEDSARVQAHPGREPQIMEWSSDDPKFEQFLQSISMLMQPTTIAPVGGKVRHQNPEPSFDTFERTPLFHAPPAVSPRRHLATWSIAIAIIVAAIGLAAWRSHRHSRADVADSTQKRQEAPAAPSTEPSPPAAPADVHPPAAGPATPTT